MWLRADCLCLGNQKSVFTKDVSVTGKCQDNVLAPDIKIDTILKPQSYPRSESDPGCIPDTRMAAGLVEEIDGYLIWLSDGFLIIS
jgi:hypothetical protein